MTAMSSIKTKTNGTMMKMISEDDPKHPKNAIDEMCTCGHPQTHHDCAGHLVGDRLAVVVGHGPCAMGESIGYPCPCEKYTFKDFIFKGDENYKKFKYLYEAE